MYREKYFLVIFICIWRSEGSGLYAGDSCITKDGARGVCRTITQCLSALEDIKRRKQPEICLFGTVDPVVCCAEEIINPRSTTSEPAVSATTEYEPPEIDYGEETELKCRPIPENKTAPRTGQKAWDKCIEYQEKYMFPCEVSKTLLRRPVRGNNCRHKVAQLVVGGVNAAEAEFPHMALLGFGPEDDISFHCGGSVISEKFILTAGHCTYHRESGVVTFTLLGALKRSDTYDKKNLYKIATVIKHPNYAPPERHYDIALLETDRLIRFYLFVIPACLDVGNQPAEEAWATGWGDLGGMGGQANTLQKVKLTKFTNEECSYEHRPNSRYLVNGIDPRTQTCYGDKTKSKDTCQGDSGGPLQMQSARVSCMYVIVGVTSFGTRCGILGVPGVYTRVEEFLPWIESIVWP